MLFRSVVFENNTFLESVNVRTVFKTTKIAVLTLLLAKYNDNEVNSNTFALHVAFENNTSLESVNVRIVFKTTKRAVLTLIYNENEVISDTFALHAEFENNTSLESVNVRTVFKTTKIAVLTLLLAKYNENKVFQTHSHCTLYLRTIHL